MYIILLHNIYIYIYIERERYIYIYTYTHIYIQVYASPPRETAASRVGAASPHACTHERTVLSACQLMRM